MPRDRMGGHGAVRRWRLAWVGGCGEVRSPGFGGASLLWAGRGCGGVYAGVCCGLVHVRFPGFGLAVWCSLSSVAACICW